MQVLDEFGQSWRYRGGDPCARLVNKLSRMNYRLVVLPFVTLATGKVTAPVQQPASVVHQTRLADCLAALNGA